MTVNDLKRIVTFTSKKIGDIQGVYLFGSQNGKTKLSKKRDIDLLVLWGRPIPSRMHHNFRTMLKTSGLDEYKIDIISITRNQLDEELTRMDGRKYEDAYPSFGELIKKSLCLFGGYLDEIVCRTANKAS